MQTNHIQHSLEASLARYVAMPTVVGDTAACNAALHVLAGELQELNMHVKTEPADNPWLIATTTAEALHKKHVKVLLVVHFDVVPLSEGGAWAMRTTKDRLYGRGVYDMKFAASCYMQLIRDYAWQHKLQHYDIGVLIVTDEEKGGYDGAAVFLESGWTCDIAIIPDGGWNWSIESRAKGITYIYIRADGRSTHSSRPWLGQNPLHNLAPALDTIAKHFKNDDPQATVVSINSIESSNSGVQATTQTPSWVRAGITIRSFDEVDTKKALTFIKSCALTHHLKVEVALDEPAIHLQADNELVKKFIAVAREVHGAPIKKSDAMAASDARHFAKYNIPTVVMYPTGGDHHGPREWIARNDLFKYYLLIKKFVEQTAYYTPPISEVGAAKKDIR